MTSLPLQGVEAPPTALYPSQRQAPRPIQFYEDATGEGAFGLHPLHHQTNHRVDADISEERMFETASHPWVVLRTRSHQENIVEGHLRQKQINAFLPKHKQVRRR